MSRTVHLICIALEALDGRDPGAVSADELLMAVSKALPGTSAAEFTLAAKFLRRLASRLRGGGWLIDPENRLARTHTRARDGEGGTP
jgi:hypothetical protein